MSETTSPKFKRILLKLSGEALLSEQAASNSLESVFLRGIQAKLKEQEEAAKSK